MPRMNRIIIKDAPHHITQRGNYKQKVFFSNKDRINYLKWVKEYTEKYNLAIWAYCLMDNHVHFIIVPKEENSISRTFNALNMKYAQYINKRKEIVGHLWQGRFYSCVMDEKHTRFTIRYIEQNPVRAGLVKEPWEWKWSSAAYHVGKRDTFHLLKNAPFLPSPDEWREELRNIDLKAVADKLIHCTRSGFPFANPLFIKKIEKYSGINLKLRRVGRPRKIGS